MGLRVHPEELDPNYRNKNFEEVTKNLTKEQAIQEANRCLNCKNARCISGCPVGINIPAFISELKEGKIQEAGDVIRQTSLLPSV